MVFLHLELFPDHNNYRKFIMGIIFLIALHLRRLFLVLLFCLRSFSHSGKVEIMS